MSKNYDGAPGRTDEERLDWLSNNTIAFDQIVEDVGDGVDVRVAIDRAMDGWEWEDE